MKIARGPVSRVLSSALLRLCDHSSRRQVTLPLKQSTRVTSRNRLICHPYSILHPVGFTMPLPLPAARCALAAPFRPYPSEDGRFAFCGTIPEPCQSRARRALPGTVVPWSPDFPRPRLRGAAAARPSGWASIGDASGSFESGKSIRRMSAIGGIAWGQFGTGSSDRDRSIPVEIICRKARILPRRCDSRTANCAYRNAFSRWEDRSDSEIAD